MLSENICILDGKYIQEIEDFLSQYEGETEVVISTSIEAIKHSQTVESTSTPSSEDFCHYLICAGGLKLHIDLYTPRMSRFANYSLVHTQNSFFRDISV